MFVSLDFSCEENNAILNVATITQSIQHPGSPITVNTCATTEKKKQFKISAVRDTEVVYITTAISLNITHVITCS